MTRGNNAPYAWENWLEAARTCGDQVTPRGRQICETEYRAPKAPIILPCQASHEGPKQWSSWQLRNYPFSVFASTGYSAAPRSTPEPVRPDFHHLCGPWGSLRSSPWRATLAMAKAQRCTPKFHRSRSRRGGFSRIDGTPRFLKVSEMRKTTICIASAAAASRRTSAMVPVRLGMVV